MERTKNKKYIDINVLDKKEKQNGKEKIKEVDKKEKKEKKEEKESNGVKYAEIGANFLGYIGGKIIDLFSSKKKEDDSEIKESIKKNTEFYRKKFEEMQEMIKKMNEEKNKDNQLKNNGMKEWNKIKENIIVSMFNNIDKNSIKKIMNEYLKSLDNEIIIVLDKILNELNEKLKNNSLIQEKCDSIYKTIKDDIKEIKTFNFMLVGFTGVGKSCLANAILGFDKVKEGDGIKPETSEFKQFANSDKEPGISIYDTIGIESTNLERGITEIKKKVEEQFNENLENPDKSLHGILYCINNGPSVTKIEEGEIKFILDLNKLYGENDILIIVFTQSVNDRTEDKIKQLRESLKNDRIEIVEVLAKDQKMKTKKQECIINAFGIDELKTIMKKKCENKLVKCNLKQIVIKKIKKKYEENIQKNYEQIKKMFKSNKFEKTLNEECDMIIQKLIGNLIFNFEGLDEIMSKYINKEKLDEIKNKLYEQNKVNFNNELFEEFNVINEKYGNQLSNFSYREIHKKFDDYFASNIIGFINQLYFGSVCSLLLEKFKEYFSEVISINIKDEEIDKLVKSNMNNILKN